MGRRVEKGGRGKGWNEIKDGEKGGDGNGAGGKGGRKVRGSQKGIWGWDYAVLKIN